MTQKRNEIILIHYLRLARVKALKAAITEAISLYKDLEPEVLKGGPLATQRGVFWIRIKEENINKLLQRLPLLGYTQAVDIIEEVSLPKSKHKQKKLLKKKEFISWKNRIYRLNRIYSEDKAAARDHAPDRRQFLFETKNGEIKLVKGYRGSSHPLSRRGLPYYDCRLLVNLVYRPTKGVLLDPFAGIGGLILEAKESGWNILSIDIDPSVRHGLAKMSDRHIVADACKIPLKPNSIDAVATELPFHEQAKPMIKKAFLNLYNLLRKKGRIAIMCAPWEAELLRKIAIKQNLKLLLDSPLNRKGFEVIILAWVK